MKARLTGLMGLAVVLMSGCLGLLLLLPSSVQAQTSASDVASFASTLSAEIDDLLEGLGVSAMKTAYDSYSYTDGTRDGTTIRNQMVSALETKLSARVDALTAIRDVAQTAFASPPTGRTVPPECCTLTAPPLLFSTLFHTDVDLEGHCYRYPASKALATGSDIRQDEQVLTEMLATYLSNQAAEPNLKWQYVGTQQGTYSIFPSVGRSSCDNYDPRIRPWYVLAATPDPKDVIVVIDTSGSMGASVSGGQTRLDVAKEAADVVLDTLSPNDRVTVMEFNSVTRTPSTCFGTELGAATPQSTATLKSFVSGLTAGGGTIYGAAFETVFDLFSASATTSNQQVVLFLTDGAPTDGTDGKTVVDTRNSDRSVKIFTYAFGAGLTSVPAVLQDIADSNGGVATYVPENGDLRTAMGVYYEALSTPDPSRPAVWTTPYFDASGLGVITSAALPVYESTTLVGVAAVDLTLTDLLGDAAFFDGGELSYAFVIDDRGRALIHPNLALPDDITDDPSFVDISLLETQSDFTAVRTAMLNRETGSNRHIKSRALPRGDSTTEGVRTQNVFVTYYYAPVANTPFTVAVVLADDDMTFKTPSLPAVPANHQVFHRVDVGLEAECHHFGQNSITTSSTYKFAPSMYVNPALHIDSNLTEVDVASIQTRINSVSATTPVLSDAVALTDIDAARVDVWTTDAATTTWLDASNEAVNRYAAWRYIGTARGTFRTFPGHPSNAAYDPRLRPWYSRALTNEGAASFSTAYEDAAGAGLVITMSHTITPSGVSSPIAVMGLDFSLSRFQLLLDNSGCTTNLLGTLVCLVMDDSGYIVFHPDFVDSTATLPGDISAIFISDYYPQLATRLSDASIFLPHQCHDFMSRFTRTFYIGELSSTTIEVGASTVHVAPIANSNLFLLQIQTPSVLTTGSTTTRPSTTDLVYDECDDVFTFDASVATCPAPDAGGSLAFEPPLLPGLDSCYGSACTSISTKAACDADIACVSLCDADGYCAAAGATPISCPAASPSPAPILTVTGTVTIAGASYSAYASSSPTEQSAFKSALRSDLAAAAGLSSSEVEITSVSAGSIKADFEILTRDSTVASAVSSASLSSAESHVVSQSWCESSPCDLTSTVSTGGDDSGSGSSSVGVIVAVVVVVLVVVAVGAAFMMWRKKKKSQNSQFTARQATATSAPAQVVTAPAPGPAPGPASYAHAHATAPPPAAHPTHPPAAHAMYPTYNQPGAQPGAPPPPSSNTPWNQPASAPWSNNTNNNAKQLDGGGDTQYV